MLPTGELGAKPPPQPDLAPPADLPKPKKGKRNRKDFDALIGEVSSRSESSYCRTIDQ